MSHHFFKERGLFRSWFAVSAGFGFSTEETISLAGDIFAVAVKREVTNCDL